MFSEGCLCLKLDRSAAHGDRMHTLLVRMRRIITIMEFRKDVQASPLREHDGILLHAQDLPSMLVLSLKGNLAGIGVSSSMSSKRTTHWSQGK